jgi:hypothetical protein
VREAPAHFARYCASAPYGGAHLFLVYHDVNVKSTVRFAPPAAPRQRRNINKIAARAGIKYVRASKVAGMELKTFFRGHIIYDILE